MTVNSNSSVFGASSINNIQNMDLETAMMAVQSSRANQLENQLKDQISAVQAKNEQVSQLNGLLSQVNTMVARFDPSATATSKLGSTSGGVGVKESERLALGAALKSAGFKISVDTTESGSLYKVPKSEWDALVVNIKGSIDSLSNTQQMDMLRLQSLSNKRNEAFDVMSNFIKKMQDSRSSILGNMR